MPSPGPVTAAKSRSNHKLRAEVAEFSGRFDEILLILPDGGLSRFLHPPGTLGQHAVTLSQALRQLADPQLAARGLAPVNALGAEAVSARALFRARQEKLLRHFEPVSGLPGFARALARTLLDLRLAGLGPADLEHADGPLRDLSVLLELYEQELESAALTDLAGVVELATAAARQRQHRWAGLPLVLLDVPLASHAHRQFVQALAGSAPEVLAALNSGNSALESALGVSADDLDTEPPAHSLDRLRRNLFEPAPEANAGDDGRIQFFSAPGEGLEAMEIARRILQLAREGVRFDDCAVLLRSTDRYQPAVEDAFRRAGIPAYFSRGATRPEPAGRAFLTLLSCAAENLSASRFAEYMSLGQVPQAPAVAEWVAPADDLLNNTWWTPPSSVAWTVGSAALPASKQNGN
jgi:ATP-dependent helicase/nuclease subunit B